MTRRLVAHGTGPLKRHVIKRLLRETVEASSQAVAESMRSSVLAKLIATTQDVVVVAPHIALQFRPKIGERW